MFRILLLATVLAPLPLVAAPPAISPDQGEVAVQPNHSGLPDQWRQGPFVEIYVRGFRDSNGDGRGDLRGVIEKLDYLQSVGYTGIWLMPVFDSEDRNHGYAVRNYRRIEPAYGSNEDLRLLAAEAHKRGMGLILDYIPNQAASVHPLFEDSTDRASPYRDWFIWSDTEPEGWSGFTGEPWQERRGAWYYAVYDRIMPDWNWRQPGVMDFHLNNLRYWLNHGVDGFRLDAVGPLVENGPMAWQNQPESVAITHRFGQVLQEYPGPRYQVCEAPGDVAAYAAADGCGSAFAFGLQQAIIRSVRLGRVDRELVDYLATKPMQRLATFLSNHDTFAGLRLQHQLEGDGRDYRLAAATHYLLPGIPFTLYGEELGLGLATGAGGTDEQIRSIMPWTADDAVTEADGTVVRTFGGFTRLPPGRERRLFRPLPDNWKSANVATQEQDPGSLLHFYRRLIALRKAEPALAVGSYQRLEVQDRGRTGAADRVFAFLRQHGEDRILVLINYSERPATFDLSTGGGALGALWPHEGVSARAARKGRMRFDLAGKGFAVYRVGGA